MDRPPFPSYVDGSEKPEKYREDFSFTGTANDYFGIWFVNGLLNMLTLGLYSPWAKVRTLKYFYGNTELAGGRFDFTAKPIKMLLSRIIALALVVLYFVLENIQTKEAFIAYAGLMGVYLFIAPVILIFMMSFRLRYSTWSGIHFSFNKDYKGAYRVYLLPVGALLILSLSFLIPTYSEQVEDFFEIDRHDRIFAEQEAERREQERLEQELLEQEEVEIEFHNQDGNRLDAQSEAPGATIESADLGDIKAALQAAMVEEEPEIRAELSWSDGSASLHMDDQGEAEYESVNTDEELPEEAVEDDPEASLELTEEDLEDVYINPYFFIPSGIIGFLFLLLMPYFDFINMRFLSRNVCFGHADFTFHAKAAAFYKIYGIWLLVTLLFLGTGAGVFWQSPTAGGFAFFGLFFLYFSLSKAYFKSRRMNVVLSNLRIDQERYRVEAKVPFLRLFGLLVTNTMAVIVSMGLLRPWAQIRVAGFLLSYIEIEGEAPFNDFKARLIEQRSALGEEIADAFDLEFGI